MSRKAEFLAVVKTIVDKDSNKKAKQSTIELAQELSDVLNAINVKPDTDDFKELKDVFNEQLAEMGKQPIVFSENTLKGISAQFANAISEGIKAGVADAVVGIDTTDIEQEFNTLIQKRKQKIEELDKLSAKQRIQEDKEDRLGRFETDTKERIPFKTYDELKKKVQEVWNTFENLNFDLQDAEDADKITEDLLRKWQNAAIEMQKVKNTIYDLSQQIVNKKINKGGMFATTVSTNKAKDLFGERTVEYFLQTPLSNDEDSENLWKDLDYGASLLNKFLDSDVIATNIETVRQEIAQLNVQIDNLTQKHPELNVQINTMEAEERLKKVQEAYDRLLYKSGQKKGTLNARSLQAMQSALDYEPKSSKVPVMTEKMSDAQIMQIKKKEKTAHTTLDSLAEQYVASEGKNWEQRAQALIKFVKEYKAQAENPTISHEYIKGWEDLYKELSPIFAETEAMLRDVISLANGDKISQPIVNNATKLAEINKASADIFEQEKKAGEDRQRTQTNEKAAEEDLIDKEKERLRIAYSVTDAYDEQYRLKAKQGEKIEVGATADSKTGKINQVVRGDQNSTTIPNSSVSDVGIHSHWTRVAAPSPLVEGLTETGDLRYFRDELSDKSLFLIRAMEEAVLLDFSQISEEALNLLISDYDAAGAQIAQQWESMSLGDKLKKFGSLDESAEAMQVALKEAFLNIVSQYKGFATYIQKPMWPIQEPTRDDRRKELIKQLDSYDDNVLDSQTADEYIEKRKEIFELLQKEGLLTDEIKTKYDEVNKKLQTRADLIREAESYYDDSDDIITGQRVTSVDSAEQFRKDHIRPFDNVIDRMRESGFFSDDELEDSFMAISRSMEQRARNIAAKDVFAELDKKIVDPNSINDAEQLNRILQERNVILNRVDEASLIDYDNGAYEEAIKLNQAIKDRIDLLQKAEVTTPTTTGTGDASSEELKSLQNKNEQLRQEKENAEKDKNAANERANKAEAEAERLRNELVNRDKVDSDKSPSGATPIDTSELESLLGRVTYKVKFEGESPLDNSAAVLETVKSALGNIQVNASADKDAPWAREATLSGVIKNTLENIKSNTTGLSDAIKIAIAKTGEKVKEPVVKDYKKVTKDDYVGSTYFPEKLKTQVSKIEEYRAKLATSGRLTQEMDKQIDDLLEKLRLVKNGPEFSVWSEEFKKLRIDENTSKIFDDFIGKENKNLYQELIDLKKQEYEWEIKLLNAQQGSAEETNARQELEVIQEKIKNHSVVYEDYEQELKLQKMQEEQLRKINELSSKQVDSNNKQKLKEETEVVKELNELYQQLAQAKAMADAETDSILRKPFEDRANQIQSEIYAKEANIDRAKYSQQFDNTQKESYKKQIIEELLELYAKLGEAEAKEDRMSIGNATAQQNKSEMDALYKRIEATQKLIDVNEELQNQFDAAQKTASDKVVAKANKADAVSDDKSFEKLGKQYEKLGKLRAQAQSTGSAVTQEDARQLEEAIKKEQERVSLSKEQTEELKRRLEVARQNELLRQNSIKQQKGFEQQIKDSRSQARLNTVNSTIRSAEDINRNAMMIDGVSPESLSKMKELNQAIELLKQKYAEINAKGGVVSDEDQKDVVNQIANVKKLSSEVNDLVKEYNNMNDDSAKMIGKFNGQLNGAPIDEYKRQLTEAVMAATNGKASIKGFDAETKTLTYSLKSGSHEFTNYTAAVRDADGALVSMQKETKRTETFIESITRKTKEIGTYLISSLSLYDVVNKFRQGIQYVREIDSALVELRKVTDETEESYDRFLQTASKTGAKIGSTISDYTRATATFAKLGYSIDMASEMAEAAIIYQNVGDGIESADAAAESIISTMKGFGLQASDAMSIVDKFNQVGNEFSITSKGIGDALQRSASALAEGDNTLDESIGLITAANSVVQDPETVGKAMCRR